MRRNPGGYACGVVLRRSPLVVSRPRSGPLPDDALYVRAYNGRDSRWYLAAMRQKAGRITAAGMTRKVAFELVEGPINDRIDKAYGEKYRGSQDLSPMIGASARAAMVRVTPKERG